MNDAVHTLMMPRKESVTQKSADSRLGNGRVRGAVALYAHVHPLDHGLEAEREKFGIIR